MSDKPQAKPRARISAEDRKLLREWVRPGERVGKLLGLRLIAFNPMFSFRDIEDTDRVLQLPPWVVHRLDSAYSETVEPLRIKSHEEAKPSERQSYLLSIAEGWAGKGVEKRHES